MSIGMEAAMFNNTGVPWGGGLTLGYGRGTSVGLKASWLFVSEGIKTLELNFLFRFYLFDFRAISGPFLQIAGGPAFFFTDFDDLSIPADLGMFSAGIEIGWRFLLDNLVFLEPSFRVGYPYILGGGITAGMRF